MDVNLILYVLFLKKTGIDNRRRSGCSRTETKLGTIVQRLQDAGIKVSMFIDADSVQVDVCAEIKAYSIEIHTGKYPIF